MSCSRTCKWSREYPAIMADNDQCLAANATFYTDAFAQCDWITTFSALTMFAWTNNITIPPADTPDIWDIPISQPAGGI